jgi:uncharacterized protein with FMN-binding domain
VLAVALTVLALDALLRLRGPVPAHEAAGHLVRRHVASAPPHHPSRTPHASAPPKARPSASPTPGARRTHRTTAPPVAPSRTPVPTHSPTPTTAPAKTYTGDEVDMRYGPVQVRITVRGSRIVDVVALQTPDSSSQSREINDYAKPRLRQEALDAQSANIDTVSGATYTSDAYAESLQSAIDQWPH